MDPYRILAPLPPRAPPRGFWKTRRLRLLLWLKGPWRKRWVRCAVCRKGLLPFPRVHRGGGNPGDNFVTGVMDQLIEFPCGHTVAEHKGYPRRNVFLNLGNTPAENVEVTHLSKTEQQLLREETDRTWRALGLSMPVDKP